jgi:TM2 domain-containing membrane protein YozV
LFCSRCGTQLNEGSAFCSRCGAQVAPVVGQVQLAEDVSPKSRLAVTLLAAFLGWVGAHRFYMGKIKTAVVMLLLGVSPIVCMVGMFVVAAIYVEQEDAPVLFWVFYGLMYVLGFAVGIWVLVDFIIAVTGNFKDKQGKPIKKW